MLEKNQLVSKSEEKVRLDKLKSIQKQGIDAFPAKVKRTHKICEVLLEFDDLAKKQSQITIVGRLRSIRGHGGSTFANIEDGTGKIQAYFKKDEVAHPPLNKEGVNDRHRPLTGGLSVYDFFVNYIDVADFIQISGKLFITKKGEKTLQVTSYELLTKALLPLPEKWHGLQDVEERYRKRYLDLLSNEQVKKNFIIRSHVITSIREFLNRRGFVEVETPTLQPVYGGGFAKPFKTHHNVLDTDFYLRISDEMYLKRLIVGGFEKIYEITKVFRNEGIDKDHNPEFTMFEAQIAFEDYTYGMDIIEELIEHSAFSVLGTAKIRYEDIELDFKRPWKRMKLVEAVKKIAGVDSFRWQNIKQAKSEAKKLNFDKVKLEELERMKSIGEVIAFIFEEKVEKKLIQPTIIYDYPTEVSPLAKKCEDPRFAQRFEMFATGFELGNNYSELNDPLDLKKRFIEEKNREKAGFEEAHQTDLDYLTAIKHGFPPTCGIAIGIDRLIMLFTNASNIKEVIFFPTLKPKS